MRAFDGGSLRPTKSEFYQGRGGGGYPGHRGRRGQHRRLPPDERSDLRQKITRLGDSLERVTGPVIDVARLIVAFIPSDTIRWTLPELPPAMEEDTMDLLHAVLLSDPWLPEGTNSAFLVDLLADCIMNLPHKHSYYSALCCVLLRTNREDVNQLLQGAYGIGGAAKDELVMVKGELMEDGETIQPLSPSPPTNPPQSLTKHEQGPRRGANALDREAELRLVHFFGCLIHRLKTECEQIFRARGGLHKLTLALNAFRFFADCVNLSLLDAVEYLNIASNLLQMAHDAPLPIADVYTEFGINAMLWLGPDVFQAHRDRFEHCQEALKTLCQKRSETSRSQVRVSHPLRNMCGAHGYRLSAEQAYDQIDLLMQAVTHGFSRVWVSKAIPRLYESPKMKDFKGKNLLLRLRLQIDLQIFPETWTSFAEDLEKIAREEEAINPKPVQIFQPPMSWLFWKRPARPGMPLEIFSDADLASGMDVERLGAFDVTVIRSYVNATVSAYFQDPDLCAEQLLLMPIRHDQFIYVLVEEVFTTCLAPPYAPLATMGYSRLGAVFMAQLFHRLCILEHEIVPKVAYACEVLLRTSPEWDELTFHQLVEFTGLWVSFDERYAHSLMAVLCRLPVVNELCVAYKPEDGDDVKQEMEGVTYIATPLAELDFLKHQNVRFLTHFTAKVKAITSPETFDRLFRPLISFLDPPELPLETALQFLDMQSPTRRPEDISEMRDLRLSGLSCLEATILRWLLRTQVTGMRECNLIIAEVIAFLQSRMGLPFIRDISEFSREKIDQMLFLPRLKSMKRDLAQVKSAPGDDSEEEPSTKRRRNEAGPISAPIVKVEATEITEDTVIPVGQSVSNSASGVVEPRQRVKEEMGIEETPTVEDNSARLVCTLPFPTFEGSAGSAFAWDWPSLTKLLANVLICIGSRTLSHSQKVMDLYVPLINKWRDILLAETGADSTANSRELIQRQVDTIFVNCISEAWLRSSLPRFKFVLQHHLVYEAVRPENVLAALLEVPQQGVPFLCTVAGDALFSDILETIVGLINSDVPARTAFATIQLKDADEEGPAAYHPTTTEERRQRLAGIYGIALQSIATTCERTSMGERNSEIESLASAVVLNKFSRLLKDAHYIGATYAVEELAKRAWPKLKTAPPESGVDMLSVMHEGAIIWRAAFNG